MNDKYQKYKQELQVLKEQGALRTLKNISKREGKMVVFEGKQMLNLSSNDYLGISGNKKLLDEFYTFYSAEKDLSLGGTSSRLLSGNHSEYFKLEQELAVWNNKEAALFFNSGYHANIGILPALTTQKDLILSDKLNHASIIDGLRLCKSDFVRYKHADNKHLEQLLKSKRGEYENIFIVSESVFSMDGDIVDLERLVELKNKYNCFLYLDEAHAAGVFGQQGAGIASMMNLAEEVDIIVGTCGKAMASVGAYAATNVVLKEYLINKMRSLIFTTSLPPVNVLWNRFVLQRLIDMNKQRKHLAALSSKLRNALVERSIDTIGHSNIVPVIVGKNEMAVQLANHLQKEGYLIFPIRPPTVAENSSRIRISLTANIEWNDIKNLADSIANFIRTAS